MILFRGTDIQCWRCCGYLSVVIPDKPYSIAIGESLAHIRCWNCKSTNVIYRAGTDTFAAVSLRCYVAQAAFCLTLRR